MNNNELDRIVNNLYLLDADNKRKALTEISHIYGSVIYREILHRLANKIKNESI